MRKFLVILLSLMSVSLFLASCTMQKPVATGEPTILIRPNPRYVDRAYICANGDSVRVRLADEKPICMVSNRAYNQAYMEIYKGGQFLTKVVRDLKATLAVGNYEVLLRDRISGAILSRVVIDCYI